MENNISKEKKNSLVIYKFELKLDDNSLILGNITVNNDTNNIKVILNKKIGEFEFSEPMSDHPWFLKAIYILKEKQNKKKAITGLFIKKG
jgi:hypothetical protein